MKKIRLIIIYNLLVVFGFSQVKDSTKSKLVFTSFLGKSTVLNTINKQVSNGTLTMTGLEIQFKNRTALYGEVNFDSYLYNQMAAYYSIKNNLSTIALTIGGKYYFKNTKFSPYTKLGLGIANISFPIATVKNGFTSIAGESNFSFQFQGSVGLLYNINKQYGVYADAGYQKYFTQNYLPQNISLIGFKIGVISAF